MSSPVSARRGRGYVSLKWKLLVGFTLLFTLVFAAAFYWFYSFSSSRAMDRIRHDLQQTLEGALLNVDGGSVSSLRAVVEAGGVGETESNDASAVHEDLLDRLDAVHQIEPEAWPYIYVPGANPGEVVFLADLFSRYDPERAAGFGESYTPAVRDMVRGVEEEVIHLEPYTDRWGSWISGFAPLRDDDGEVVAALGVDFGAQHLDEVRSAIANRILAAFAISYAALLPLVYLVARAFTGPIARLTAAAETIGSGDYGGVGELQRSPRWPDEIGILNGVFATMAGKVQQREQRLVSEVKELRIEIDEVKRQEQVSEIVESDFFQELQQKAHELRKRSADYDRRVT